MGERWGSRAAIILGSMALGATALLAPPGGDLWEALASPLAPTSPGAAGTALWQALYGLGGLAGVALLRWAGASSLAFAVLRSAPGGRLLCGASVVVLGLLLPWGPGLLFYLLLAAVLTLAPKRPILALTLGFLWPVLEGGFLLGGLAAAAAAAPRVPRGAWRFALAPWLNPVGLWALATGSAFDPLVALGAGHPGFAPAAPGSAPFYLAVLWGITAVVLAWPLGREGALGFVAAAFGAALRPLAGLPVLAAARGAAAPARLLLPLLLSAPFALWLVAAPRAEAVPAHAVGVLRTLPAGGWVLETDLAWSGPLAVEFGRGRVAPALDAGSLRAFRSSYPGGLLPPFPGVPETRADLVLLRPQYPEAPFRQALREGWYLVAAAPDWALFARETPLLEGWIAPRRYEFYSPFSLPPEAPRERLLALGEARRLLREEPSFLQVLRDAGRMETDFGAAGDAVGHLRRALELAPSDAKLFNDLGAALQVAGEVWPAREAYIRSIALDPSELLPRFNLASLCLQEGKDDEAKAILAAVMRDRPRSYLAYRRLAQVLVAEKKTDEARAVLDQIPPDSRLPEDAALLRQGP